MRLPAAAPARAFMVAQIGIRMLSLSAFLQVLIFSCGFAV